MDRDEVFRVLKAFETSGLEYVLIGAAAMGVHGLVRATEDLDVMINATPENVERLRHAFRTAYGEAPSIGEISTSDLLGDYPAVRYYPPTGDLYFDVMTRLGEMASFETIERETTVVGDVRISVATPRALHRLTRDCGARERSGGCHRPPGAVLTRRRAMTESGRVQRFRSIEEMNAATEHQRAGSNFERFLRQCARYRALSPRVYPRGVFKFRTLDEAQRQRG